MLLVAAVAAIAAPPPDARSDYQLGGDYEPAAGVRVVVRDWFAGAPLPDGLAVAQKNGLELTVRQSRRAGFDFAIAEECARYRECGAYRARFGDRILAVEYRRRDFQRACRTIGDDVSVVLRDRALRLPGAQRYRFAAC